MAELTKLSQISNALKVSVIFVNALVGLSKPARHALRLQLTNMKRTLQAKLSTMAFKARVAKRKHVDILKAFRGQGGRYASVN